ncbi:methyltransferase family protein [Nonomuraea zeae]|uniref:Isoprenylcysteine carboxylmethyltransferase family protein n=1 Tax=Nonomuraea zeae TaxID=1642303 RepID=A0A5S4GP95_9ACTN|nr:isoprenylcysteine carboxylmethyltransferase family protein [Nonomuraea zeae]TMR28170.1 isoprenylcysteine carboxylmethyltransferase family protein [Nonomuraea zeae]
MNDPALIRSVALFAPMAAVWIALARRRPGQRDIAAMIVATAWNLLVLGALNVVAVRMGWWTFGARGALVAGVPADLLLGWALLWGALPACTARAQPLPLVAAVLAWLDLAMMPLAEPVVVLGEQWLYGEAAAIGLGLLPGLLLARWTAADRRLPWRVSMQVVLAGGLMLGVPIALTGAWRQPAWALGLLVQVLAVPLVTGLAAVREFTISGGGTPVPYDPPKRLVTSGPYAYLRNPMQSSMAGAYLVLAVADLRFAAAALVCFAYGAGLASWHEGAQLLARYGDGWTTYRTHVRAWLPRLRPYAGLPHADVHVAATCERCAYVGGWIGRRRPASLRIRPAESHPAGLRRMTYERADGLRAQGVAAFAHVAQHLHLGWAILGWFLLLPGVGWFAQLCADAFGAGPASPASPGSPGVAGEPAAGSWPAGNDLLTGQGRPPREGRP